MPIWDWTTEEVWSYIREYGLPVPDIYDSPIGKVEGATRWNLITPSKFKAHPLRLIERYCDQTFAELLHLRPELREVLV
jgi:3'-phosphoadenosine 5'-phosphosulfate sulfotransferase (PAPS reductase)/FAD synthetase